MQQRVGKIEQASELIRSFTPTIVDGLLQTPDYVRAMGSHRLAGENLESFVTSRAARQQILDTDRQFQKIITEGATAIITDPADIADYDQRHTFYSQLTVAGDPARAVLTRLTNEYRALA